MSRWRRKTSRSRRLSPSRTAMRGTTHLVFRRDSWRRLGVTSYRLTTWRKAARRACRARSMRSEGATTKSSAASGRISGTTRSPRADGTTRRTGGPRRCSGRGRSRRRTATTMRRKAVMESPKGTGLTRRLSPQAKRRTAASGRGCADSAYPTARWRCCR